MGMYEHSFIKNVFTRYGGHAAKRAVETGTCLGYSTRRLSRIYSRVDTVELDAELSHKTQEGMLQEGCSNVRFHVGDSAQVLRALVGEIHEPCLFYLDAHWSGDATVDWNTSEWKGYGVSTAHRGIHGRRPSAEEQVPLLTELQIIHDHFAHNAVIYIDDLALFGPDGRGLKDAAFVGNDWSHLHIDDLKKACEGRLMDWIVDKSSHQVAIVLSGVEAAIGKIETMTEVKPLLGLVMIVKNEAARIADVLDTYKDIIDHWTVLDTGSTDGTQDIIRHELAGIAGELHEEPFVDFATSRNRALELHGTSTTFAIMPNGDSLVGADALRTFLEAHRSDPHTAYKIRIAPGHYYHPLVMRTGCGWHYEGRTHECLHGAGDGGQILDVMLMRDRSQRTDAEWKARWTRDIDLLKLDIADKPGDPRGYFYLGQTYDCLGQYEDALTYYSKRATMHGYFDETFETKLRIGKMCEKLDRPWSQIVAAYLDAHTFDPRRAEPLCYIAEHYHEKENHSLAYLFASRAAELPKPATDLFLDEDVYRWKAADLAAIHGYYLDDASAKAKGRVFAEKCVRVHPGDERLRANWAFYAPAATEMFAGYSSKPIDFQPEAPWVANNPSIFYDGISWRCIARTVNYKIVDGRYLMPPGDNAIRTRNFMLDLDGDLDVIKSTEMIDKTDIPRSSYPVHGFEDCRLFKHEGNIHFTATVCDFDLERAEHGPREIVLGELDAGYAIIRATPLRGPWSHLSQKNWMPRSGDALDRTADLIYAASPGNRGGQATVFDLDGTRIDHRNATSFGHGRLRGGSQLVRTPDGWLCLVHDVAWPGSWRLYLHRFVLLSDDYKIISMTDPFFFERKGIEFCAGLAFDGAKLVASYGVEDCKAHLGVFDLEVVCAALRVDYQI
jgi:tetratricopeptide (TPR) repeat protein